MADQRFLPRYRLRRGIDFQRVYRRRCVASDEAIVVYGCASGLDYPRLGLSVSRKVGGAVVRGRWKRILREAFRLRREELPVGVDLVIAPRAGAVPELPGLLVALPRLAANVARRLKRKSP